MVTDHLEGAEGAQQDALSPDFVCLARPYPTIVVRSSGWAATAGFDGDGVLRTMQEAARLRVPHEAIAAAVREHPRFGDTIFSTDMETAPPQAEEDAPAEPEAEEGAPPEGAEEPPADGEGEPLGEAAEEDPDSEIPPIEEGESAPASEEAEDLRPPAEEEKEERDGRGRGRGGRGR